MELCPVLKEQGTSWEGGCPHPRQVVGEERVWSYSVTQVGVKLVEILLPQPLKFWCRKHESPVLGAVSVKVLTEHLAGPI